MLRSLLTLCLVCFLPSLAFSQEKAEPTPPAPKAEKSERRERQERPEKSERAERPERDSLEFLDNIDYPEIQVVPRASERLETEAQFERDGGSWLNQWSFLLSGTSTLAAAMVTSSSLGSGATVDQQNYIKLGQIVGGLTLSVGIYYSLMKPYDATLEKVKRIRGKDKRSALLRERTAEEALERTASTIGSISVMSVWANLITSAVLANNGDTNSRTFSYAAVFASTLSMMFTHPYITNWEKHKEYKHKIYTPLPQSAFFRDPHTGESHTYFGLAWNY